MSLQAPRPTLAQAPARYRPARFPPEVGGEISFAGMKTTVRCECGALYEREEHLVVMRWRDPFNCKVCRREIEDWSRSRKATFKLIRRPAPVPSGTVETND